MKTALESTQQHSVCAHHKPLTQQQKDCYREALNGCNSKQLKLLDSYYQKHKTDKPDGYELFEAEINRRKELPAYLEHYEKSTSDFAPMGLEAVKAEINARKEQI